MKRNRVALWERVSTGEQTVENQEQVLREYAKRKDWEIVEVYSEVRSGISPGQNAWNQLINDARLAKFDILLTFSVSRLTREGIEATLKILRLFTNFGIGVESISEPFLSTTDPATRELLIAIMSYMARTERERISQRTKAGLQRAKKEGKKLGRPTGKKDKKPRCRRWKKKPLGEK